MSNAPRTARLTITQVGREASIKLNDLELSQLILSESLKIEFVREGGGPDLPQVSMTFAPGALDFEMDADLIANLLRVARDKAGELNGMADVVEERQA